MRLVILESPFAGDVKRNLKYARACARDCLLRGEAPFGSHLIYTQPGVLDDDTPADRKLGMEAGFAWKHVAQASVFYTDLGWTPGMKAGADASRMRGLSVEVRSLGPDWESAPEYKTRWE
jgi:hypothetical protein